MSQQFGSAYLYVSEEKDIVGVVSIYWLESADSMYSSIFKLENIYDIIVSPKVNQSLEKL